MGKKRMEDAVQYSFCICGLAESICKAAVEGNSPYSQMKDVIREAVYQWGIVNIVREPEGGLRLARVETVPSPFGARREATLYRESIASEEPHTTTVILPAFLDALLRTAVEDVRNIGRFPSRAVVINIAIIQWGLTHLELTYENGEWDLARPLALRQAFDFAAYDVPIRTVAFNPDAVSVPEKVFPPAGRYAADTAGNVAVPFYRPDADKNYLAEVESGKHAAGLAQKATEPLKKEAEETEDERIERINKLLDSIDFD